MKAPLCSTDIPRIRLARVILDLLARDVSERSGRALDEAITRERDFMDYTSDLELAARDGFVHGLDVAYGGHVSKTKGGVR